MPIVTRPKGSPKVPGSGRKMGGANLLTRDLKQIILEAADEAGGKGGARAYLAAQAKENPAQFLQLLGKCIPPAELAATQAWPKDVVIRWQATEGSEYRREITLKALAQPVKPPSH